MHRRVERRVLERVLDQVHERALDLVGVGLHGRRLVGECHLDPGAVRAELVESLDHEIVDHCDLDLGLSRACLQPGEIEQVPDQLVEPVRLVEDGVEQLGAVGVVERQVSLRERAGGGEDPHQRRPEIVTHRAQERRLDRVAPPQRLGLDRLAREPLAVDRDAEERGQPGSRRLRAPALPRRRAGEVDRAEAAPAGAQRVGFGILGALASAARG